MNHPPGSEMMMRQAEAALAQLAERVVRQLEWAIFEQRVLVLAGRLTMIGAMFLVAGWVGRLLSDRRGRLWR